MDYTPFRGRRSSSFHLWFPFPATRPIRSRHLITWSPGTGRYPLAMVAPFYEESIHICIGIFEELAIPHVHKLDFDTTESISVLQNRSGGNFEGVKTGSKWALEALLDGFRTPDQAQRGPKGGPRGAQTGPQKRAKKIKKPRGSKGRARNLQKSVSLKKSL